MTRMAWVLQRGCVAAAAAGCEWWLLLLVARVWSNALPLTTSSISTGLPSAHRMNELLASPW